MPVSSGLVQYALSYGVSPVYLSGGIAGNLGGGMLPLINLLQAQAFPNVTGPGAFTFSYDDAFAQFIPMPGASLIANQVGEYPFANQATAANAIITQPLNISLQMICPARQPGDAFNKAMVIGALVAALNQHILSGGLFAVATPAYFYDNCVMTGMRDISGGESKQPQWRWQLDFRQPLVTQQQAQTVHNALMSKLASGAQVTPNANGVIPWSGAAAGVGDPNSGQAPSYVPASNPSPGLGFGGSAGTLSTQSTPSDSLP